MADETVETAISRKVEEATAGLAVRTDAAPPKGIGVCTQMEPAPFQEANQGVEKKINPYDGKAYSFEELFEKYKSTYGPDSTRDFWEKRMTVIKPKVLEVATEEQRADEYCVLKSVNWKGSET